MSADLVLCGLGMLKLQALTAAAVTLRLVQAHRVSHTCCSSPRPPRYGLQVAANMMNSYVYTANNIISHITLLVAKVSGYLSKSVSMLS